MSTANAPALRSHLQTLCDSGAAIGAFPDAGELITTWGASPGDIHVLVKKVRDYAPDGYFVPAVCQHTDMKVIMCRGNGHLFTYGLMATMSSISYCKNRLRNLSRNFRRVASGFPPGSAFRADVEAFCNTLDSITDPSYGPLSAALGRLPGLARAAGAAERKHLAAVAASYAS